MEEVAMGFHVLAAISLAVVALAPAAGAAAPNEAGAPAGRAAFERLKALVGSWEAESPGGRRVRLTYELAAGGSVLVERYTAGDLPGGETMLTTYYLDGERLMLTHYCVAACGRLVTGAGLGVRSGPPGGQRGRTADSTRAAVPARRGEPEVRDARVHAVAL
jgi:hypothetical protein